ncbi:MAG: sulfatase-like hydrolase/transferase [Opitutaceae bacterium]|nr:sulfatase-like hydrolase/transferase [Cephaloticoccus sp.]MCP5531508.1 sulfatase-like hydrolase/transferase [Opitutaceae bacterium]
MPRRPHIIYILSDEHCGLALSQAGDPNVRTPHMDRLAAEGVSFARAYANCPVCTPSRGTIFSGRHAHAGPVQGFFDVFKASAPSTATMLREAGYHTAYFGKWHCGVVRNQVPPEMRTNPPPNCHWPQRTPEYHRGGFQDWNGFEVNNAPFDGFYYHNDETNPRRMSKYQTDELTDLAIDYLNHYDRDEPLFLVLSVEPPHFPLDAPKENQRFDPTTLQVRGNFEDTPAMREQLAMYYAMIENLDQNIGRLRDTVEVIEGFKDETLTVYFSDHGDFMGSHGIFQRKEYPHEESVRIPAIFHWPQAIPARGLVPELWSLVDLASTTLGLAGVPCPPHVQGIDYAPLLRGEDFTAPEEVLLEMQGNPRWSLDLLDWRGLVTRRWKYAYLETGHELLFDLANDPLEQHNLAPEQPEACQQWRRRLLEHLRRTREPYFDVLIEHGTRPLTPVHDVAPAGASVLVPCAATLSPAWDDMIRRPADAQG